MRTGSLAGRLGRFRTLAVGVVVLSGLAAGGSALTAAAADAATMDSNPAACGSTTSFFPQGDVLWMTDPSSGLQYVVAADAITTDSGPVGYMGSVYGWPGRSWQDAATATLSTSSQALVGSFGILIGYNDQTSQYDPEVVFSSCTWTAQFALETASGDQDASSAPSGTNIAGYYQGMAQDQGIMNSVDSDEGAGITADPGGDAGAGDGD
jgi:hypothetical protein